MPSNDKTDLHMEKEQWKDRILGSLEGANRAVPRPEVYHNIRAQLTGVQMAGQMTVVRRPVLALAAACLALLLTANVWALKQQYSKDAAAPNSSVYQLDNANFDLY